MTIEVKFFIDGQLMDCIMSGAGEHGIKIAEDDFTPSSHYPSQESVYRSGYVIGKLSFSLGLQRNREDRKSKP